MLKQMDAISKRASVTSLVLYACACFMARYRSQPIRTKWIRDVSHKKFVSNIVTGCNAHDPIVLFPTNTDIVKAMNIIGWIIITPTAKSDTAVHASRILDFLVLNRDFVRTATTTKPFKTAVKGSEKMLKMMRKRRTSLTSVAGGGSSPPGKMSLLQLGGATS